MRLHHTLIVLSLIAALFACTAPPASQTTKPVAPPVSSAPQLPPAIGETVSDIGDSRWIVFQDKDNNYWFGTDGNGVCRYDGTPGGAITRFTTKDGLSHDQVRGIQQHGPTGDILITTNAGVSKFDGQKFTTLSVTEMKSADEGWVLDPDDVWLPIQPKQMGPYRYDGKTLYHLKFPKSPQEDALPAAEGNSKPAWSPYEVYCVYKDSRGHMWFGTANLGIYRFDGKHVDWMYEDHLTNTPGGGSFGIRSIIEDRHGDFWFCNTQFRYKIEPHGVVGQEAGRIKYTREKGMDLAGSATTDKFFYFQSITEDNNRDLWMAPYAGGVWKYDGKKVTHYPMKNAQNNEITMFTIYKDNRGDLWVGTHEHGAYKFNGKSFERFRP
jgi:ligand-binding sensor domain-containing protein